MCDAVKIAIVVILIWYFFIRKKEGYMPFNDVEARHMVAKDLMENEYLFKNNLSYDTAKTRISWLEPVIFHDAKRLYLDDKFKRENLEKLI